MYQVVWVPHYLLYIVHSFRENKQLESATLILRLHNRHFYWKMAAVPYECWLHHISMGKEHRLRSLTNLGSNPGYKLLVSATCSPNLHNAVLEEVKRKDPRIIYQGLPGPRLHRFTYLPALACVSSYYDNYDGPSKNKMVGENTEVYFRE